MLVVDKSYLLLCWCDYCVFCVDCCNLVVTVELVFYVVGLLLVSMVCCVPGDRRGHDRYSWYFRLL